jgi:hypothetical protein
MFSTSLHDHPHRFQMGFYPCETVFARVSPGGHGLSVVVACATVLLFLTPSISLLILY